MAFEKEFASGDSLIWLENSPSIKEFDGKIVVHDADKKTERLPDQRNGVELSSPNRVIAIDGSSVSYKVKNGFPGAEATLVAISVVAINLELLSSQSNNKIVPPNVFRDMEDVATIDAVLPGANVARKSVADDTPKQYFRSEVYSTLENGRLNKDHESLLETLRSLTANRKSSISCPNDGCEGKDLDIPQGTSNCTHCRGVLYETDALRFSERFNDLGSNGEVHGEFRHILEVLSLLNILRYFAVKGPKFLAETVFILDGPLAVFGHAAWLTPYIREELTRINEVVKLATGKDIVVFGFEKSGQFYEHFEEIDWTDEDGPRSYFENGAILVPGRKYINRNIVFRPENSKPHGADTYFGRKLLYKTHSGDHAVVNLAMTNDALRNFDCVDIGLFPRLEDVIGTLDELATYLYNDGFMPLIRAHAHAAIPLRKGENILASLFSEETK